MHRQAHPDPEQLDRLRAGLLDDAAGSKAALVGHLETCATCRAQFDGWAQIGNGLQTETLAPEVLKTELQRRRRTALAARPRGRLHALVPYATAAMLLVAVTVGLWTAWTDTGMQTLQTAQTGETVPDIYEDLDFYLWLANQEDKGAEEEPLNPSNT